MRSPKNCVPSCAAQLVRALPMKRAFKPYTTTLIKALPALALALSCVVSTDGYAGEYRYYRDQPVVLARGNARALARLGFRYENGFGVPQNYFAAADLYQRAAERGDAFGQSRLGLSYDRGHGVAQVVEGQRLALIWAAGWADEH